MLLNTRLDCELPYCWEATWKSENSRAKQCRISTIAEALQFMVVACLLVIDAGSKRARRRHRSYTGSCWRSCGALLMLQFGKRSSWVEAELSAIDCANR